MKVLVGLTGDPFAESPTWTDLTSVNGFVGEASIRRGRTDELDRTETGTAQVKLTYTGTRTDPTGGSALIGRPAVIVLTNPVTAVDHRIFRGFVDEIVWDVRPSQVATDVTLELVDALAIFAGVELKYQAGASPHFGYQVPAVSEGNIFYEDADVNVRIEKAIAELTLPASGWPVNLQRIFSGNVGLKETIYSPGTPLLNVIHDAADSEFPGIANFYVDKEGIITFHGRSARLHPAVVDYDIQTFKAGDGAAIALDSTRAQIRSLRISQSRNRIINHAYAAPEDIADADIAGQVFEDATSIGTYGYHAWSAENLLTEIGYLGTPDRTGLQETALFAQFYVANYKTPRKRVDGISFKSLRPDDARATSTWDLICDVDISDIIDLSATGPGIAVAEDFYVEGLSYRITPLQPDLDMVTLDLDVSPTAWYTDNVFE